MDNVELLRKLGIRIAYIRKLRGWNQETLAKSVGITRSYISKIETGNQIAGIPIAIYFSIASVFDMPLWRLVKIDEDKEGR